MTTETFNTGWRADGIAVPTSRYDHEMLEAVGVVALMFLVLGVWGLLGGYYDGGRNGPSDGKPWQ
jgi:hypothetical protein